MEKTFLILFDSYHLYHLPQFEPLINLLSKDDRFEIFHSTSRTLCVEEFKLCSQVLKKLPGTYIQAKTEDERASLIKSLELDIFICGWSRYDLNKFVNKTTLVGMIYHGIGIKPSYWLDNHERLDFRLVEGEYRIDQLKKNNIDTDLHLTGFIKMDPLFNKIGIDIEKTAEQFELDPKKKTILFAPTFYPSSIESLGMKIGEYSDGYNLLIKPHLFTFYLDKFGDANLRPQMKILRKLSKKFQHVHLIPPQFYNIIPFYKIADVLITDASSTIYEMLALGKPVIVNRFFKLKLSHQLFRKRLYKKRLDADMENDIGEFCYQVTKPIELSEVLNKVFKKHDKNSFLENGFCEKMLFKNDGGASIRAKNIILSKLK
jgi:hypothetical protein